MFLIVEFFADLAAANLDYIKTLSKDSPFCPILCNWVLDNFILADEPFAKALQSLKTSVLVKKNYLEN